MQRSLSEETAFLHEIQMALLSSASSPLSAPCSRLVISERILAPVQRSCAAPRRWSADYSTALDVRREDEMVTWRRAFARCASAAGLRDQLEEWLAQARVHQPRLPRAAHPISVIKGFQDS